MTRGTYVALTAALALSACAAPVSTPSVAPVPAAATRGGATPEAAAATITAEDMYARIAFLASDYLRGRETPSPELNIAAAYLVNQHMLFGLEPAGEERSFFQWYPFPLRQPDLAGTRLEVGGASLVSGRDYFTSGATAGAFARAPLVFVGTAPEALAGDAALRDKIGVSVLPGGYSRDWRIARSRARERVRTAGAQAIVHVLSPEWTADSIARYSEMFGRPRRVLGGGAPEFPEYFVSYAAARRVFATGGVALDEAWADAVAGRAEGITLAGVNATGAIPSRELDAALAPNVVAVLPGSDPELRDEYVVLSAHMDHVGVGEPDVTGDSIYNGADDDASGTSALLEIAQAMAALDVRPKRSVVFLHVSGEEKGLLGSRWYSDHPTLPLGQVVANINVDMIARNAPDSVVVIGKDYSTLGRVANQINRERPELGLVLADDIWPEERFFFRSDHFNFARKEIPSIFFFTGVHEDYHRPSDEVERIDADKAARVTRAIFYLAWAVANAAERPEWYPAGLEEVRALTR